MDGDRITYLLEIVGAHAGGRLVIRCDPDGGMSASIRHPVPARPIDTTD